MTASATPVPAATAAFSRLIDYAGLFPPAQLEMAPAVREYLEAYASSTAWMLGRFIVRQSQLSALPARVPDGEHISLSLILDGGIGDLEWAAGFRRDTRRASIDCIEIALSTAAVDDFLAQRRERGMDDVPAYVETGEAAMSRLAAANAGAKIRCGGVTADAYPTPGSVAAFVCAAVKRGVPFKATAGLHHPVRHYNRAAGVTMHGFLNLLAGAALAIDGAGADEVERAIACEDAAAFAFDQGGFAFEERRFDDAFMRRVRERAFIAYGSCSFAEPVADLQALGILP